MPQISPELAEKVRYWIGRWDKTHTYDKMSLTVLDHDDSTATVAVGAEELGLCVYVNELFVTPNTSLRASINKVTGEDPLRGREILERWAKETKEEAVRESKKSEKRSAHLQPVDLTIYEPVHTLYAAEDDYALQPHVALTQYTWCSERFMCDPELPTEVELREEFLGDDDDAD